MLVVGPVAVFQHAPRTVTGAPPSLVMFPPLLAVVNVIDQIAVVVSVGTDAATVEKLVSFPYAVTLPLLMYALM